MKRLIVLFGVLLMVFPLVMTGCGGVAEADYDAVVAERDALQTEKSALQAEKDALATERDGLEAELDATKSDLASLVAGLDKKLTASVLINGYFIDALDYITGKMSLSEVAETQVVFVAEIGEALDDVGDDDLSQLWDDAAAAAAVDDIDQFSRHFADILALLQEMIESDMAAITARLS